MRRFAQIAALPVVLAAAGAAAQDMPLDELYANEMDRYRRCVELIETRPSEAHEQALIWRDHGGGASAEHCAALALIALDEPEEGAIRLEELARGAAAGPAANRAELLSQAGNAWLLAGQPENAEDAFDAALKLTPEANELLIDRARALAMRKDWVGAEADLTTVIAREPDRSDLYVLRASARHAQGRTAEARQDIDEALRISPLFPDALVERGAMKLEDGDAAGARTDWSLVLRQAPNSTAADSARQRIEALEMGLTPPAR